MKLGLLQDQGSPVVSSWKSIDPSLEGYFSETLLPDMNVAPVFLQLKQTRQFSFRSLFFLTVVFWCFFKNTSYATTFPERRNQLCLVKKEGEG